MSIRAVLVLSCAVMFGTGGCMAIFKNVDLTFAKIAQPITEVLPVPDAATLVLAHPVGAYDGGKQSKTLILEDGTAVGQVTSGSFAVAHIPAGSHTIVVGTPELGDSAHCALLAHEFRSGKVYVVNSNTSNLMPVTPQLEHELSMLSHLELDIAAGQQEVRSAQESFWNACIKAAREKDARMREFMASNAGMLPPPSNGDLGVDKLTLPEPP